MSTPFYDLASLVVVPSGYKASKVYAQKPLTTDGQLAFTRSTTATRVNSAGLIETVASNVPRLDYLGSSCPRLLLEPQRTNSATYSEQFDNAAWTKTNATISANVATSPAGFADADKLIDNATLAGHFIQQTISITGAHTFSVFAKASESSVITLQVQQTSVPSNFALIYYDLISGQVESGDFSTSLAAGTIQEMGNGWYRCTITYTPITAGTHNVRVFVAKNIGGNKVDYVGNGTDGVFLYGCQLEAGAYATSYIPTLGASVTRGADACVKTGISSLIGQTEGTLFVDFDLRSAANTGTYDSIINIATDANNSIDIVKFHTTSQLYIFAINGGVIQVNSLGISGTNILGTHKLAVAYKLNDYAVYLDGVQVFTDTSATVPACSNLYLGAYLGSANQLGGGVAQALLFKTRLTNAQLAELTTI